MSTSTSSNGNSNINGNNIPSIIKSSNGTTTASTAVPVA